MNKNKLRKKQKGNASIWLLLIIVGVVVYNVSGDNDEPFNANSFKLVTSKMSSKLSRVVSNDDYSGYGVQLMATQKFDQAKSVMNDFSGDGYSAFVLASKAKGRTFYKVRLGPYEHKPEALAVQDKVIRRYPSNPYVKSSLVIYKPN